MALETTQEITLHLPTELVERIEQAASQSHRPAEKVVAEILETSLPPLRTRLPDSPEEFIAKFRDTPKEELERMTRRWFPEDKSKRLSELVELERERPISEAQEAEIDDLLDQIVNNAVENAAAQWLLKQSEKK